MVLVTPEFFSREVFGPPDGGRQGGPHKGVCRHHSVLLLSACDVDSVCCCQMLQKNAWARSHFNDRQVAGRDVAVDLVFVRSAADALHWLDKQLEASSGALSIPFTFLSAVPAFGAACAARLPYYERIFLIGFGAACDGDAHRDRAEKPDSLSLLYAALTDVLIERASAQKAREEVSEAHDIRAPLDALPVPDEIKDRLRQEVQQRETELRRECRVVVLDSRRPVHQALMQEERWLLLVDDAEVESLWAASSLRAAGARSRGSHYAKPNALVLAAALQPLYPIEGSMYSYLGAVSAAACLHLGRVTSEEYNDWVIAVRGVDASSFPFVEDDANSGLLPLLRNGCLEDSLRLCPELLFKAEGAARSFPWRQRLQQLANQLRVSCGIECRDMQQHFNGLSGRQQQTVFGYLRQTLSLPDRLCLNWIRHTDDAKHRGTFSSVPNADTAWLLGAVLSKWQGAKAENDPLGAARANAVDALHLLKSLTTAAVAEKATGLQLLQQAQQLLRSQLSQLFLQVDLLRCTVSRGMVLGSVKNASSCLLRPFYLRLLCLLVSLRQAGGNSARRLPVVLLCLSDTASADAASTKSAAPPSAAAVYCCTPGADRHSPDLFPEVLVAVERLSATSGQSTVFRDPEDPNLLRIRVQRLGLDVQKQVAVLHAEAARRREEMDNEEGDFGLLAEDLTGPDVQASHGGEDEAEQSEESKQLSESESELSEQRREDSVDTEHGEDEDEEDEEDIENSEDTEESGKGACEEQDSGPDAQEEENEQENLGGFR